MTQRIRVQLQWYDPNTDQTYEHLGELPITLGRQETNTIPLLSNRVSRTHATINHEGTRIFITDHNSSNGTLIGNKRIYDTSTDLKDGALFMIDPFEFKLQVLEIYTPEPVAALARKTDERPDMKTMQFALPTPLNKISDVESIQLQSYLETVHFKAGDYIFKQGASAEDGCYIVDNGIVRIELDHEASNPDDAHDDVLVFIERNSLIGELSLLDRAPRSANAIAHTDVQARRLSLQVLEKLTKDQPGLALRVVMALGKGAADKLRETTQRLDSMISAKYDPRVEEMIAQAEAAQRELLGWSEERLDALLQAIAGAVYQQAVSLAEAAVQETKMGNVPDKILKNQVASLGVYQTLAQQKGFGLIGSEVDGAVLDIASPVGIVFGLVPVTNPTSTFVFKVLVCLKARNAVILSPNRKAAQVSNQIGDLIRGVLREHGAPEHLVQWVDARANRKTTVTFMSHKKVGMILATGGPSMVKAAYSSGNPAIGVGSGNAPVLITATADIAHAAHSIVMSKSFDNGLICGSEHNLVVEKTVEYEFIQALTRAGAAVLSPAEATDFAQKVIDPKLNGFSEKIVGQDAAQIAATAGISRPYPIRLIVVPASDIAPDNAFAREKMAPVLSLFTAPDTDTAFEYAHDILAIDGAGHTAIIYSQDAAQIERFGLEMPASRILVNSPGAHGVVGISTALTPSLTLGCGTFGGNSTTDNVSYKNLMNVKRLAYFMPERLAALVQG